MMLGFALDDNGGRNGQCDKQRMIPSMIIQEFTAMLIHVYFVNTRSLHFLENS